MKKVLFFKIGALSLIILGVVVFSIGIYYNETTKKEQSLLKEEFNKNMENSNSIKGNNGKNNKETSKLSITPIAMLQIPKINLEAVVAEGTSDHIIKYAVGHFENTVRPGETGNCALIGHRNFETGEFFLNVHKLEKNNDIIVITSSGKFTYKVKEQYEVEPEQTSILNNTKETMLTLITCSWNGKKRLVTTALLVSTEDN